MGKESHIERAALAAAVTFDLRGNYSAAISQRGSQGFKNQIPNSLFLLLSDHLPGSPIGQIQIEAREQGSLFVCLFVCLVSGYVTESFWGRDRSHFEPLRAHPCSRRAGLGQEPRSATAPSRCPADAKPHDGEGLGHKMTWLGQLACWQRAPGESPR